MLVLTNVDRGETKICTGFVCAAIIRIYHLASSVAGLLFFTFLFILCSQRAPYTSDVNQNVPSTRE